MNYKGLRIIVVASPELHSALSYFIPFVLICSQATDNQHIGVCFRKI